METIFHPLIVKWFKENIGNPTDIQKKAWPEIASGNNVLITAPTGSGKTLTAFLFAINQLVTNEWETGTTRVLYVSPLKALNNDIKRNLIQPLEELNSLFESEDEGFPRISVMTRSGDTTQSDRRKMVRHPPEILITTPESLNLLLSSQSGRTILTGIKTVILDEIHAVVGDRRGVHLITAVDRIVRLAGEFQRVALSATVRPLEKVAEFVGGFEVRGEPLLPGYIPRRVSIIRSDDTKEYRVLISFPPEAINRGPEESIWDFLADECREVVSGNRSTLIFTNSRRLCEKITYMVNQGDDHNVAYAHHGSLSREIRTEVEQKLKNGDLKAIVATSSLEMGIDIGALDEVVLLQSPHTISSAIQRIGRAGHRVGEASRCTLFPTHDHDFLQGAILAESVVSQDIESVEPVKCPLDVLSQIIISMTGVETWDIDDLYMWIRTSYPYRELSRAQFDLVLDMLAGKYSESRIRELNPRISIDRIDNRVRAKKGALLSVYMSGGTIPDRGYYKLRHKDSGAVIGELDEEYVWEARTGQLVTFGTGNWKIHKITHNDVFVVPSGSQIMDTPFWRSNELNRDFYFSEKISSFLEMANDRLDDSDFEEFLREHHFMDETSSGGLCDFMKRQKEYTNTDLPHRHHILFEVVNTGPAGVPGSQLVIHTMWGGRLNRPYAMAINAAWMEKYGEYLEIYPGNDSIVFQLKNDIEPEEILSLVTTSTLDYYLKKQLEKSGFFGARFRECAGRALLITRNRMTERMPLWMTRLRSKKLLEKIIRYEDFPILIETWRTCLNDEFDMENLKLVLGEIASGTIRWSAASTVRPSPFASDISWNQINQYMYELDQPAPDASALRGDLLQEVIASPELRPVIDTEIITEFISKRQRLYPGYSPQDPDELLDWVKERALIPNSEWEQLLSSIERDTGDKPEIIVDQIRDKLVFINLAGGPESIVTSLESFPLIKKALNLFNDNLRFRLLSGKEPLFEPGYEEKIINNKSGDEIFINIISAWLSFYGPVSVERISQSLGVSPDYLAPVLESLVDSNDLITGKLIAESRETLFCDSENYEILLRIKRSRAIPAFDPLETKYLPLFLARYQGVVKPDDNIDGLFRCIEQLLCLPLPADLWETAILPARLNDYKGSYLDRIIQESELCWTGFDKQKTAFCFGSELDLFGQSGDRDDSDNFNDLFSDTKAKFDFFSLMEISKSSSGKLVERLWNGVWEGKISNDSFAALRRGIENRFKAMDMPDRQTSNRRGRGAGRRAGFSRWKGSLSYPGNWFRLPEPEQGTDLIEEEELKKDRVRLLFDRYGILFRELLSRELPEFSWKNLFRSLRLMELSGEILSGYFFKDLPGPQFVSRKAFQMLINFKPEDDVFWINAMDPVSMCGIRLDFFKGTLPRRLPGNHIVYRGIEPVMFVENNGKILSIMLPSDDPNLESCFSVLKFMLEREFSPLTKIIVDTINGEPAMNSPYLDILKKLFDVQVDYKKLILYRKREY
ncbi:MAG: DEAD/DEAH box helicase [Desulfobacteraceae bacterium]|jgi:ATP-dependent Lhr-like helicase